MKKAAILVALVFALTEIYTAQNFTYVRGSTLSAVPGSYGTMGVASSTNDPGARHGCATWVDQAGNLWLFGGEGYGANTAFGHLSDLWKYNILLDQWTWVKGPTTPDDPGAYGTMGVPSTTNNPGAREFTSTWVDASGNFWMFGGYGFDSQLSTTSAVYLGDLWRYNPSTNEWTWMHGYNTGDQNGIYGTMGTPGIANKPGSRQSPGSWTDAAGNFWLFGGRGFPATGMSGALNDLWRYNVSTNQWTWMGGNNTTGNNGIYGTQGVAAAANNPGGRNQVASWKDPAGNFYLFGGLGHAASGGPGYLNDLWKYDPSSNMWTWLKGPNSTNNLSVHGTKGVPGTAVSPGGRYGPGYWSDPMGNLWLLGGIGYATQTPAGLLNDMYRYIPSTNEWTWMKGSQVTFTPGTYGPAGVASPTIMPGAREYITIWRNIGGSLWLIGGEGIDGANSLSDHMNDLWRFDIPCNPDSVKSSAAICSGSTATLTAHNQFPGTVQWYTSSSGGSALSTGSVYVTNTLTAIAPTVITLFASTNACTVFPRTAVNVSVLPAPVFSITAPPLVCNGVSFSATASGSLNYIWSNATTGGTTFFVPVVPVCTIGAAGTDSNGCTGYSSLTIPVGATPQILLSPAPSSICSGYAFTMTASGAPSYTWNTGSTAPTGTFVAGVPVTTLSATGTGTNGCPGTATLSINTSPSPAVLISGPAQLCMGQSATYTASGANSYSWSTGQAQHTATLLGTAAFHSLSVTGFGANGCNATALLGVMVNPVPTLSVSASSSVHCRGTTTTLTALSSSSLVTWNGSITATSITVAPIVSGNYSVVATLGACSASMLYTIEISPCTDIADRSADNSMLIYPNPAHDFAIIESYSAAAFVLYDATGRLISEINIDAGKSRIALPAACGIYYYRATTGTRTFMGKLVVE